MPKANPLVVKLRSKTSKSLGSYTIQDVFEQGPFLGIGILAEHQIADQAQVRLQDHQRFPRQAGVEPLTQRPEPMIGPRQDIAIEDPGAVARKDRLVGSRQLFQDRPQLLGAEADDGFTEIGIHPSEFAVECLITGGDRWFRRGLVGGVGREHGGTLARGNLDEQVDQCVDRQLEGKLFGGMYPEELFEGLRVQEGFHDATDHDAEGHRRTMRQQLDRNHPETWLSEEFLKTVELPGTTSVGTGIGTGAGSGTST